MNRARKREETGDMYAEALKNEAQVMKFRLRGRYIWKTFYPIDALNELPRGAQVFHRDQETGAMIRSNTTKHADRVEYLKFPPYRVDPQSKRKTFSEQRAMARVLETVYADSQGSEESETPLNNGDTT